MLGLIFDGIMCNMFEGCVFVWLVVSDGVKVVVIKWDGLFNDYS